MTEYKWRMAENKLTVDDFVFGLKGWWVSQGERPDAYMDSIVSNFFDEEYTILGPVKVVADLGGEGQGDSISKVFYVEDTDQYFRIDGWWQSHVGGEYDGDFYEVHYQEKMVVVYE